MESDGEPKGSEGTAVLDGLREISGLRCRKKMRRLTDGDEKEVNAMFCGWKEKWVGINGGREGMESSATPSVYTLTTVLATQFTVN